MPPKVYLDSPPNGDFRAMPARGDGFALLKWVTSFPRNPERGPAGRHRGAAALRRRHRRAAGDHGLRLDHLAAHRGGRRRLGAGRWPRTARARSASIGCGVNGAWAARCLAAAGYGTGVCADPRPEAPRRARGRARLGRGRSRERPRRRTSWSRVTPGSEPVILASDLRPGQHLAVLGADAGGKGRGRARPRSSAAGCSATSGSRRLRAASWPAPSAAGAVSRERRDRARGRDRGAGPRAGARPRRSPCSTRPASRSRTWPSRRRSTRPGARRNGSRPLHVDALSGCVAPPRACLGLRAGAGRGGTFLRLRVRTSARPTVVASDPDRSWRKARLQAYPSSSIRRCARPRRTSVPGELGMRCVTFRSDSKASRLAWCVQLSADRDAVVGPRAIGLVPSQAAR